MAHEDLRERDVLVPSSADVTRSLDGTSLPSHEGHGEMFGPIAMEEVIPNLEINAQMAVNAEQAAKKAEETMRGKQTQVDKLQQEVREAEAVVQEEAARCQRTEANLRFSLAAAFEAAHLVRTLTKSLRIAKNTMKITQKEAEEIQQDLTEKTDFLDAAKCRVEELLRQLYSAKVVLTAMKQAACKAMAYAKNITCDTQQNRTAAVPGYFR